ncbi:MAG: hypothetical protein IPI29_05530 [Ignavibacteria bacterium]|nr:hypothetical protein [Ignavibacteria bacterium]
MTISTNHKAPYQYTMILCILLLCAIALGSVDAFAQLPVRTRSLQLISNNNTNLIEHRAPNGILSNFTYTWPSAYPTNPTDNFLTSTPAGVLSWANYDNLFWRLDGNATATAASFIGPTAANIPLNLSTSNATPGSIDLYIGPVAAANRRITLNNSSFDVGTAGNNVSLNLTGALNAEGVALINTVGTANTTIGNAGAGASTVTLNAGATGDIVLGGVDVDAAPTEFLTITAGSQVRRSTLSGSALEGIVYSAGAYRLGGTGNAANPFLVNRYINMDASNLSFTSNGGASTTMLLTGGANSGVAMTTAGTGSITLTGPTSVTGNTTINTTGAATTTIGNVVTGGAVDLRSSGVNPITIDVGVNTNNLVFNNIASDGAPAEFLTINASNQVRRSVVVGPGAQEGITFTANAYRLGGVLVTENPFLVNRFVNIDASNLSFTSNGGASTTMLITGGANSGVAMTTAGTGTIGLTGTTNVNTTGTANTTIGNTGVGATTVTLNAGTTGNIVLGGVDADAAPTEILTITATNEVRRSTLGTTALEGVVFTAGAYRLGGINATTNPFLTNRFVNIDASNLSFTSNGGASTTMLVTGGANSGVAMTTAGAGTITMTGPTDVTGATTINTTGTANTTLGNTGVGATTVTLNAGTTGDIVLGGVDADAAPTEFLTITAGNQVRRSSMSGTALEGLVFSAGAYRLGGTTNVANPFLTSRFVNIDGSNLSFTSNGGASTTMLVTGGANSGVAMTTAGTGTIGLTGTTNVNTTGTANTTIGNTGVGATTITLNAGTTGNIVLGGVDADAAPTEILTITATNEVRRSSMSGTALEGLVFSAGAYRLGGTTNVANPFLTSRFVNIDASNLSFTSNGGASTTMLVTGGANSGVAMTTAGTGTIGLTGTTNVNTTGTANTTIGNTGVGATTITLNAGTTGNIVLGGVDADAAPTEILTITATNEVRRSTLGTTALEGVVFTAGAYRLGGINATTNPFLTNRFVNIDASNLSFTSNGGASTTMLVTGGANSGVAMTTAGAGTITMTGPTDVTGATTINTTGTANTTLGNTGVGATTVTLNAGTTGNIVLGGVDADAAPTEILTITATNEVRRSTLGTTALEGVVFTAGAYRLGGTTNVANPFLTSRFVNIDASNLSFTSNGGASTTMLVTGGANSGVAMTTAGAGTITMTGPTDVTGATTINTTGTANTTLGNTGVGATTITLNAGTTGNIVLGGVDADAAPTEILTITATNEVRRSTLTGTALEGLVFSAGAYRLGGTTNVANPFLTSRFVNIDASNLSFTSNGGASTTMLVTGGANSGVAMTTAGTGTIGLTGTTNVNTTGTANTTLGNTGVGATTVTLNAGTTGNIVLGGVDADAAPTEILTITATNEVRRSTLGTTALEGVVFTAGAYRLGGINATTNPFLTNRFVNIDASNLSFTSNGGASTTMLVTGGANSGVAMTTAGAGTITMTGPTDVTGATTINTTGTANTTLGNTGVGATTVTLNAGTTGNIVLGGVDADAAPTEILTITATNEVRRSTLGTTALEGVVFTAGAYRLGGINATTNPFLTNRFVNIDASNLSFTSNGGASTTMLVTGGANSGVAMTTAGTGTIGVTGTTNVNTTGTANTTLGNTGVGATTVTLNAGTTGNIVLGGVDADAAPTEILTITATNEVRRSSMSGTALEGLVFSAGAYRLGGTTNVANPFLTNRFVNIDASNLSFTSNGGASTTMLVTGGANSGVAMTTAGTGTIGVTGTTNVNTTGTANTTLGNTGVGATTVTLNAGTTGNIVLGGVDADAAPTEILTITATNEVRRSSMSGTALEGLVFSAGAYRLGGTTNVANPFLTSRFVNIDASNLSFTSNGGASTTMLVTGGANSGVAMTTAGAGTITMTGPTSVTGATTINTTGTANTTLGNTGVGATTVTLNAGTTGNIVLGGVDADAAPTEILTITATNEVRRSSMSGTALEGLVFSAGAYRLGGTTNVANPFLTSRFVNIDASNLSFTSNGGASTTMLVTGGANSGVAMTTAGTGTITMTGPTSVTGATTINTTGTANTTLGNTGVGATTVTLNAGTTGNIVLGGVDADAAPTEILTITATNEVRRSSMSGTALEGLVFSAGAYRLGGTTNVANPFLTSRFVNIDASNLSFTSNGGASTTMLVTGGANSGVAMTTAGTGTIGLTGTTNVNTTGTANSTLGNTGVGATTVTLNAGTTGNIVLGGVDADAAPTEILTITATNEVRRSSMSGTALEGLVFSAGAYRLGGTTNVANPFLTNRFVNIDASNLSFTSNGGASTTMLVTGGANSGVAMTTAGTGTITMTGPTSVTGATTINTTGTANTTLGNTGVGATTVTLNAGTTGNIVLGGVDADAAPTEILTITATNEVRRSSMSGTALEGLVFSAGAYRLGGTTNVANPFLTSRFVNIDASNLSFTSNGGASTTMLVTGGANSGVAMTTAGAGTITMTGPTSVTGATTINTTGTANTTLGNTGVGATTVTLNAGTTGNIVLGGVDADAAPTEILTITATNEVRRSSMSGTALEGLVFSAGAYRLGGTTNVANPFLTSRFVNIDASNLSFTSNGGASTTMLVTGGANSGVAMTTAGAGTITMTGPTSVTGATTINTTGAAATTIGSTATGGAVTVNTSGVNPITLDVGVNTNNLVLNNIAVDAAPIEFLTITAGNQVRRSTASGTALEGLVFSAGAYRLGGTTNVANPFLTSRFVNIDASNLSFTSNGGASTTMLVTGGANSGVAMTTAGTGTITMTGPTSVTGAATINTTGAAATTIGSTATGGAVTVNASGVNPITLDVGVNTNNLVLNNIAVDAAPIEFLTITAGNQVRRSTASGTALEGVVFTAGAYRLGGVLATDNPFLVNRFVNLNASDLAFTANGGANQPLVISGGVNNSVTVTPSGTGIFAVNGTPGVENIRAGSLAAISPDAVVAEGVLTADNTGDVRRRSAADALQILGIGRGIFTPAGSSATHVISTGAFDLLAGATINVTVFGPNGAAVHAMITNVDAAANQITVVTSATVDATFSLHWMIINP